MAATGESFGISLGVNCLVAFLCLLAFGLLRRGALSSFYAPKAYLDDKNQKVKPRKLHATFFGWLGPTLSTREEELIAVAGIDAAVYIRLLTFGLQLFLAISLWVLVVVLPTNLVGNEVHHLQNPPPQQQGFAYWLSPPPPATAGTPPAPDAQIKAPPFYNDDVPPAPPGLQWWQYKADVPPLPDVATELGANFTRFQWRYDPHYQVTSYSFSNLDTLTMSNVPPRSHTLWVHLVSVWVISLWTMWRLGSTSKWALGMRLRHLAITSAESRTILVQDVPGVFYGTLLQRLDRLFLPNFIKNCVRRQLLDRSSRRLAKADKEERSGGLLPSYGVRSDSAHTNGAAPENAEAGATVRLRSTVSRIDATQAASRRLSEGLSPVELVESEYEELYPGEVAAVHLVHDNRPLRKMQGEYHAVLQSLLDLIDRYASRRARQKPVKRKTMLVVGALYGAWGQRRYPGKTPVRVDSLQFLTERLQELRSQIQDHRQPGSDTATATAFVSFKSRRAQALAAQALQHQDRRAWLVSPAPSPSDVLWTNLRWRRWEHWLRGTIVWAVFVLLALFYLVPVSAVQALIEVDRLNSIGFFRALTRIRFINALLQATLPSLVLKLFVFLLPYLLWWLNVKQGMVAASLVDAGVIQKFFIFQVITVFLGSFLAGSLFSQFNAWVDNPRSAITILGSAAPLSSIFFLNYISLQALVSAPFSFLRPGGLLRYGFMSSLAASSRARRRLWQDNTAFFGQDVSTHTITILLGLVFSVINPLLPLICVVYFAVVYLLERYNMLYSERPIYHAGGKMFGQVFTHVFVALIFFQIIMAALLAIKGSFSAILVLPLLVVTIATAFSTSSLFRKPTAIMSVRAAVDADKILKADEQAAVGPEGDVHAYQSPVFKFDQTAHEAAVQEAHDMMAVLDGRPPQEMSPRLGTVVEAAEDEDSASGSPTRSRSPGAEHRARSSAFEDHNA